MTSRSPAPRRHRSWLPVAVTCLAVLLLPVSAVGATRGPAGADESTGEAQAESEAGLKGSADGVEVVRYAGSDQYELSIEVAQALVVAQGGTSEWVVLAPGESWADAAAAGPLAASLGAPVVLVPPGGLQTASARPDLRLFLRSTGARRVVIVGDPEVLPNHEPSVLFGLGMLPRNIERVYGDGPIGTSVTVAERLGAPAELADLGRTVIIASDRSVADAVAVGPLAAAGPFPLLLTAPDRLDSRIATYLAEHEIEHVVLVGGTAAIAPAVQTAIETAGATVTRLAGRDRSDTARLAADLFQQHTADDPACTEAPTRIGLAPARHPEQALTTGPLLAKQCTPLRYSEPDRLPADLHNSLYLGQHRGEEAQLVVFADEAQVPHSVTEPLAPPALLAFPASWPEHHPRHGQRAVAIVDERGHWRHYAVGPVPGSNQLHDYGSEVFEWSPNGRYLAYIEPYRQQLYVIDTVSDEVHASEIDDPDLWFSEWQRPVWSPDSTKLAFSAFPSDESALGSGAEGDIYDRLYYGTAEMYLFDAQTGETVRLTHNATSDEPWAWSPDSKSITFTQADVGIGYPNILWYFTSLRVLEVGTGSVTELYDRAMAQPDVVWAPDGTHVAFVGQIDESYQLGQGSAFVVRQDGTELTNLSSDGRPGDVYGWSGDGRHLLYSIGTPWFGGDPQLLIRDVNAGVDTALDLGHLQRGAVNGWSRVAGNLVYLTPRWGPYESISHVNVDTGEVVQRLEARLRAEEVDQLDHFPRARNISPDETQFAVIVDDERLVVASPTWPQGRTIVNFSDQVVLSRYGLCRGTWSDYGIRVSCGTGRDF